jgi:hypothetical protein
VLTWSRGSIGVVGSIFDLGLTSSVGLTWLVRPLALMALIKNLGRHTGSAPRRRTTPRRGPDLDNARRPGRVRNSTTHDARACSAAQRRTTPRPAPQLNDARRHGLLHSSMTQDAPARSASSSTHDAATRSASSPLPLGLRSSTTGVLCRRRLRPDPATTSTKYGKDSS